ncbi:CHAT domain-containing protein [Actinoplanes sp. NPDC051851]|uniref:CHAT domain-containing protein n=1 Tax=Actinoplanes sp. NPDC051851 TaxID=3154753 RepID=UPI00342A0745
MNDIAAVSTAVNRVVHGDGDPDAAAVALLRLPEGPYARGPLAAALITALLDREGRSPYTHLDALLELADREPPTDPAWAHTRPYARSMSIALALAEGRLPDLRAALTELDGLFEDDPASPAYRHLRRALDDELNRLSGDDSLFLGLDQRLAELRAMLSDQSGPEPYPAFLALLDASVAYQEANVRGEDPTDSRNRLRVVLDALPVGDPLFDRATARLVAAARNAVSGPEDAVDRARRSLAALPVPHADRVRLLGELGMGILNRSLNGGPSTDLPEASAALEEARILAGGPYHPHWVWINLCLAEVRRHAPGTGSPVQAALDGLQHGVWKALVQPTPEATRFAVRQEAGSAIAVARSLVGDDDAAAITALDTGRGLALFAATRTSGVADRLERAGRGDLADRWREAATGGGPEHLPAHLRAEVWSVLQDRELEPPPVQEIAAALAAVDADALVYLVPGDAEVPGLAVIAPADGPPFHLRLPLLRFAGVPEAAGYLTLRSRDLGPATAKASLPETVSAVCDWAWWAAVGPLVEHLPPRARQDRVPRVVLVPMGELARIPWHAARRPDGRFAVEDLAVSYAASARMLCHSAALPPIAPGSRGLFVGDPASTSAGALPSARLEAFEIHRAFYPEARYVGRRPDGRSDPAGSGTAPEVRDWLTGDGARGSTLHLACHGTVDDDTGAAHLLLAGDDRLSTGEIVALMNGAASHDTDLVVLAACRTGHSVFGYDEAYSLGTAFLAGGARSVLSTLWPIPDRATSVLMFVFHHYLRAERMPPWRALRAAQLWMLDPGRDRTLLPAPLGSRLDAADATALVAWAGFTHWGR